jgi:hypothetical protein
MTKRKRQKTEDNTMTKRKRQKTIQWPKEKGSTKHNTNKQKIEQHEPTKMIVICKDSNYDDQT